jgi:hypothetical protein
MRELTSVEMNAIAGGLDQELPLQSQFWGSFMYSSGFASGIFWSPVMPFIMGSVAVISIVGNGLVSIVTVMGNGISTIGSGAMSLVKKESNT